MSRMLYSRESTLVLALAVFSKTEASDPRDSNASTESSNESISFFTEGMSSINSRSDYTDYPLTWAFGHAKGHRTSIESLASFNSPSKPKMRSVKIAFCFLASSSRALAALSAALTRVWNCWCFSLRAFSSESRAFDTSGEQTFIMWFNCLVSFLVTLSRSPLRDLCLLFRSPPIPK